MNADHPDGAGAPPLLLTKNETANRCRIDLREGERAISELLPRHIESVRSGRRLLIACRLHAEWTSDSLLPSIFSRWRRAMAQLMIITETGMFHCACCCSWHSGPSEWYGFKPLRHRVPAGNGYVDRTDRTRLIDHSITFNVNDALLRVGVNVVNAQYDGTLYVVTVHDCVSFAGRCRPPSRARHAPRQHHTIRLPRSARLLEQVHKQAVAESPGIGRENIAAPFCLARSAPQPVGPPHSIQDKILKSPYSKSHHPGNAG